ncbi:MAG: NTP/NDP exchange transporter [Gemmatimonadota bacterium]
MLQRLKERFFDIETEEWPRALGLSLFFFLVIAVFWVLKPMKSGMFLSYFSAHPVEVLGWTLSGAQAEQVARVLNMVVAYVMVVGFSMVADSCTRRKLILFFCMAFGGLFLLFAAGVDRPTEPLVWSFYVAGDIWTTTMVATFWAFANDITTAGEAERMYGVVGLGGVVGGLVGASVVSSLVEQAGRASLLVGLLAPLAVIVALAFWIDARARARRGEDLELACPPDDEDDDTADDEAGAFWRGGQLVLSSKYLLGIAAVLGLYEVVSNISYFQLTTIVEQSVAGDAAKDAFFGRIGQITGLASIAVQLFGTTYVLRNHGVGAALMALPALVLMGSLGFLVVPTLVLAAFTRVSDNSLNYSINQSAKEALYTPTSQEAKYKAKAFIDMFVQRAAKVLAVGVNLALSVLVVMHVRWLSVVSAAVIAVWILVVRYLGREFRARADEPVAAASG